MLYVNVGTPHHTPVISTAQESEQKHQHKSKTDNTCYSATAKDNWRQKHNAKPTIFTRVVL